MNCLFCKIAQKEIPAKIIYEDEKILVFYDLNPQAPVHILIITKKHIPHLLELKKEDAEIIGYLHGKIPEISKKLNLEERGFRLVSNCKEEAGQSVFHLHFHLLGGRRFNWPPG
ncbi:MAG: histidine triad nucleotide-binding protein [Armatimonadetes bacterium]|nr:histidine triad nucleotide-binding protein [Armatimonadota bacterium]